MEFLVLEVISTHIHMDKFGNFHVQSLSLWQGNIYIGTRVLGVNNCTSLKFKTQHIFEIIPPKLEMLNIVLIWPRYLLWIIHQLLDLSPEKRNPLLDRLPTTPGPQPISSLFLFFHCNCNNRTIDVISSRQQKVFRAKKSSQSLIATSGGTLYSCILI